MVGCEVENGTRGLLRLLVTSGMSVVFRLRLGVDTPVIGVGAAVVEVGGGLFWGCGPVDTGAGDVVGVERATSCTEIESSTGNFVAIFPC